MSQQLLDEIHIEHFVETNFGLKLNIDTIIVNRLPVTRSNSVIVFNTDKNHFYVLFNSDMKYTLGDVQKILRKVNVVPHLFIPPIGRPNYFVDLATEKFKKTFPGRKINSEEDLRFYKTTVPYSPALVLIKEVKDGVLKCFDPDSRTGWRKIKAIKYKKIDPLV